MARTLNGEGDYMPSWDDRKTLQDVWQETECPLPDNATSDEVSAALIAVARAGYNMRKAEED